MKALSDILLDGFKFPTKGQPQEEHMELWSIDKPFEIAQYLLGDYQKTHNDNKPSKMLELYNEDSVIEDGDKKIDNLKEYFENYFENKIMISLGNPFEVNKNTIKDDNLDFSIGFVTSNKKNGIIEFNFQKFESHWKIVKQKIIEK
jgi:hypothetical protein